MKGVLVMRSRRRRAAAGMALAVAMLLGLAACGGDDNQAGGKTVLTMWGRNNDINPDLVARFNASHPDIEVQLTTVPDDVYVNKLGSAVRGRSAPDIVGFDDINGPLFAASNILQDITDRVEALPFKDVLSAGQMKLSTYQGKVYATPHVSGPSMLIYNKGLFKQAGLDPEKPPTNWAEIEAYSRKITALGGGVYGYSIPGACGGCMIYTVTPLIWASGGAIMTEPGPDQQTTFNTPEVAEALTFMRKLWVDKQIAPADRSESGATWGQNFANGKVGIWLGTPQQIPTAEKAGVDVGIAPIPGKDGGFSTFEGGDLLGISTGSQHPEEAWTFIAWALEKEQQLLNTKATLAPVRSDILTDEFREQYPFIAAEIEATKNGDAERSVAANAISNDANGPWMTAVSRIVFSGADPQQALAAADESAKQLIEQAYAGIGG
jgi:multiple sugar transport system substrate-binding protein